MEQQNAITFHEFRSWLVGLIRGKQGALPDLNDWKEIKKMLDKVEPDKIQVPMFDTSEPKFPWNPIPDPFQRPNTGNPPPVFGANGFGENIIGANSFKDENPFVMSFRMIGEEGCGTVTVGPEGDVDVSGSTVMIKAPHVDEEMMNVDEFSIPQVTLKFGDTEEE